MKEKRRSKEANETRKRKERWEEIREKEMKLRCDKINNENKRRVIAARLKKSAERGG